MSPSPQPLEFSLLNCFTQTPNDVGGLHDQMPHQLEFQRATNSPPFSDFKEKKKDKLKQDERNIREARLSDEVVDSVIIITIFSLPKALYIHNQFVKMRGKSIKRRGCIILVIWRSWPFMLIKKWYNKPDQVFLACPLRSPSIIEKHQWNSIKLLDRRLQYFLDLY